MQRDVGDRQGLDELGEGSADVVGVVWCSEWRGEHVVLPVPFGADEFSHSVLGLPVVAEDFSGLVIDIDDSS